MDEKIILILNEMSEYLSITQMKKLQEVIIKTFADNEACKIEISNEEFLKMFLDAKRIEGCSERTIIYYQAKNEINKLIKQHELNLESQRKQYEHEIAILNLEHEHQLKLKDKELENKLSGDMMNTLISEAMKNPEIKRQFNQGVTDGLKKHR